MQKTMPPRRPRGTLSMRSVVGARTYSVWLEMLRRLVPQGRTHRLSIPVASFLQYAAELASEKWQNQQPPEGTPAALLLEAFEGGDPEETESSICSLAEHLLREAGVRYRRSNHRGQEYSIAQDAASEFIRWDDLPWE